MKLFLLVAITMFAFAANSVLNRIAVADFGMDPMVFAVIRVAAGAAILSFLVWRSGKAPFASLIHRWRGAVSLAIYMLGFSWAYLSLGAGLGALILFGVLQVAMFGWAVIKGQSIPMLRWLGAGLASVGLGVLLWPAGGATVPFAGSVAMIAAAIGWAAYTILGQGESDALAASAGNFVLCLPIVGIALFIATLDTVSVMGALLAIVAGAVTSGLGYALWYRILPQLPTTIAAISQLSVPAIAVAFGVMFLAEPLTSRMLIAGILVIGGIAISVMNRT